MPLAHKSPVVCYVTDRKALRPEAPLQNVAEKIRFAAAAGANWVQIREKDLSARELLQLAQGAVQSGGARIVVNDRLDVALAAGAAGVHLGRASVQAADVVRWCRAGNAPQGFLIGVSCHRFEEVQEAETSGADYAFFGPVFVTPSKRPFGAPQGIARLGEVCRAVGIPVLAIGGVEEENAISCIRAGAAGVAAIRMFQESRDEKQLREWIARIHSLV
ncbi:MAG TPA: thiamine phosphate synthase [Candidatus Limnocylindrales bacterium]|nr:thiamine phosphate synthase [Candidatus Limnocylindrales bacterium]